MIARSSPSEARPPEVGPPAGGGRLTWRAAASAVAALAAVATVATVGAAQEVAGGQDRGDAPARPVLRVLAAASMIGALPTATRSWSEANGVRVEYAFDATSRIAVQIDRGAPSDVVITADSSWMTWLVGRGRVVPASVRPVATGRLVAVGRAGGALDRPRTLAELAGRRVALAGENVPAGRYADAALAASGSRAALAPTLIRGGSVRTVLEWVARGEADAGIVYESDAWGDPRVRVEFEVPAELHPSVRWWGAVVAAAPSPSLAEAYVEALGSVDAVAAMATLGFGPGGSGRLIGSGTGGAPEAAGQAPAPFLPSPWSAVRLSLIVALAATALSLAPAVGLGWVLARVDMPGKSVLSALTLAPLVLPPVVTGFVLLTWFGSESVVGLWLASIGLRIPFTVVGATVAAGVVGFPLFVVAVRAAFEAVDRRLEEVSATLGDPPFTTFRRVSLPLAMPGIAAGAVLAFARALGEFGATVVLAGNLEGETRTISLAIYTLLESPGGQTLTWVLVGASLALSLGALVGYEALTRAQRRKVEDLHG